MCEDNKVGKVLILNHACDKAEGFFCATSFSLQANQNVNNTFSESPVGARVKMFVFTILELPTVFTVFTRNINLLNELAEVVAKNQDGLKMKSIKQSATDKYYKNYGHLQWQKNHLQFQGEPKAQMKLCANTYGVLKCCQSSVPNIISCSD